MDWIYLSLAFVFIVGLLIVLATCKLNSDLSREEERLRTHLYVGLDESRCVCCGDIIPEGRQVCPRCEEGDGK